jgi:putative ABC transport system permease protein
VNEWLSGYAYRINLSSWIFATASVGVSLAACIAISFHLIIAARANPVKSLKIQ